MTLFRSFWWSFVGGGGAFLSVHAILLVLVEHECVSLFGCYCHFVPRPRPFLTACLDSLQGFGASSAGQDSVAVVRRYRRTTPSEPRPSRTGPRSCTARAQIPAPSCPSRSVLSPPDTVAVGPILWHLVGRRSTCHLIIHCDPLGSAGRRWQRPDRQKNDIRNGRLDWNLVCGWTERDPILLTPRFENGSLNGGQSCSAQSVPGSGRFLGTS